MKKILCIIYFMINMKINSILVILNIDYLYELGPMKREGYYGANRFAKPQFDAIFHKGNGLNLRIFSYPNWFKSVKGLYACSRLADDKQNQSL